ncbi:hypothetical protein AB1Y20_003330 [Prymnesium parvum]|uniref:Uncharacterized protein n=1 Tax=Prymnesium parvum TaxID=97485 RepID=A0AB34JCZ6_PRYPA
MEPVFPRNPLQPLPIALGHISALDAAPGEVEGKKKRKTPPCASRPNGKKGVKERQYEVDDLRKMAAQVISGEMPSGRAEPRALRGCRTQVARWPGTCGECVRTPRCSVTCPLKPLQQGCSI